MKERSTETTNARSPDGKRQKNTNLTCVKMVSDFDNEGILQKEIGFTKRYFLGREDIIYR